MIEIAVGLAILFAAPILGTYTAGVWLMAVAVNLVVAGHLDVAVRDVVLASPHSISRESSSYGRMFRHMRANPSSSTAKSCPCSEPHSDESHTPPLDETRSGGVPWHSLLGSHHEVESLV